MAAAVVLDFQKFGILWSVHGKGRMCASVPNFIKCVKRLQRCGDLTVFKMAAICHLGFLKFNFF